MSFSALELRQLTKIFKLPPSELLDNSNFMEYIDKFYLDDNEVDVDLETEVRDTLQQVLDLDIQIKTLEANPDGLFSRWSIYEQFEVQRESKVDPTVLLRRRRDDLVEDLVLLLQLPIDYLPGRVKVVNLLRS